MNVEKNVYGDRTVWRIELGRLSVAIGWRAE